LAELHWRIKFWVLPENGTNARPVEAAAISGTKDSAQSKSVG
jgi:hypothetical protein